MTRAILFGLLVAGIFSLPGYAAEPDGPASLINAKEALRIDVQGVRQRLCLLYALSLIHI